MALKSSGTLINPRTRTVWHAWFCATLFMCASCGASSLQLPWSRQLQPEQMRKDASLDCSEAKQAYSEAALRRSVKFAPIDPGYELAAERKADNEGIGETATLFDEPLLRRAGAVARACNSGIPLSEGVDARNAGSVPFSPYSVVPEFFPLLWIRDSKDERFEYDPMLIGPSRQAELENRSWRIHLLRPTPQSRAWRSWCRSPSGSRSWLKAIAWSSTRISAWK